MSKLNRCDDCDWHGTDDELGSTLFQIHHLAERLEPGGVVPSGECPLCGALAYPTEEVETENSPHAEVAGGVEIAAPEPSYAGGFWEGSRFDWVCPECGSDKIEATAWIEVNSGVLSQSEPPSDQTWCPQCEESGGDGCGSRLISREEFEARKRNTP